MSAQAHALGPRIVHVTNLASVDPRFYEVHPEVSFRAMNEGQRLQYRKKSAGGALERVELLRRQGIELTELGAAASHRSTTYSTPQQQHGAPTASSRAVLERFPIRRSSWPECRWRSGTEAQETGGPRKTPQFPLSVFREDAANE